MVGYGKNARLDAIIGPPVVPIRKEKEEEKKEL